MRMPTKSIEMKESLSLPPQLILEMQLTSWTGLKLMAERSALLKINQEDTAVVQEVALVQEAVAPEADLVVVAGPEAEAALEVKAKTRNLRAGHPAHLARDQYLGLDQGHIHDLEPLRKKMESESRSRMIEMKKTKMLCFSLCEWGILHVRELLMSSSFIRLMMSILFHDVNTFHCQE